MRKPHEQKEKYPPSTHNMEPIENIGQPSAGDK